jgi:glycosyltransferase involved in cell wall biosynthesis
MRIAHVVTYVSADGAFGGPVAVALAQTEELRRRGHDVELLAGWDGRAKLPDSDVTHRLFPVRRIGPGFGGLASPALWSHLRRSVPGPDVVHVHLARDLITLTAARIAGAGHSRLVVQPHGMIVPDERPKARLLDALITRRVLRSADVVLALTDAERAGLPTVARAELPGLTAIANGIAVTAERPQLCRADPPVVMFLARLHPRKGVLAFARAAHLMVQRGSSALFEILGPDEGELAALRVFLDTHGLTDRVTYRGAIPAGRARQELARASVYVLPAVREVFPMSVLEALSVGTPVVLGQDCAIAGQLHERGAASVTGIDPEQIADAITALLDCGALRIRRAEAGLDAVADWFSISAVGAVLEDAYGCSPARAAR